MALFGLKSKKEVEEEKRLAAHIHRQGVERRDAGLHIAAHIVPQAHQCARADCLTRRLLDAARQQRKVLGRVQVEPHLLPHSLLQCRDSRLFVLIHLIIENCELRIVKSHGAKLQKNGVMWRQSIAEATQDLTQNI